MHILQVCNKSPFPPKEGGPIAMFNLAEGLMQAGHKVDILTISTNKFYVDVKQIPADYLEKTSFQSVFIDTTIRFKDAFLNLFSSESYHVQRFDAQVMHKKLVEILQLNNFDIIQLETLYMGPYINTIRNHSKAIVVLRAHNIEHLIWDGIAEKTRNPFRKLYLKYLAVKLRKYEQNLFNKVDGIACISERDASFIRNSGVLVPVKTIPFGIEVPEIKSIRPLSPQPTFFHLGSMNWMPNQEGIRWFLDFCMPLIEKKFPDNKVFLAGRNMPSWVYQYKFHNLIIEGEVNDAAEFMNTYDIMFVPLFSGSGIRIKIVEGMALGKTIISTSIGSEGIDIEDGVNILIANTKEQFFEKIDFCIKNPRQCNVIGSKAADLVREHHNVVRITEMLSEFYKNLHNLHN
jgi:polysaccharide biosynthesis protein PslH